MLLWFCSKPSKKYQEIRSCLKIYILVATTEKNDKEWNNYKEKNLMVCTKPSLILLKEIKLTPSTKETKHKHLKVKR